jgi:hypothetical protein
MPPSNSKAYIYRVAHLTAQNSAILKVNSQKSCNYLLAASLGFLKNLGIRTQLINLLKLQSTMESTARNCCVHSNLPTTVQQVAELSAESLYY